MSSEEARLRWLHSFLNAGPREGVTAGVGDDAAVIRSRPGESLVCTVDAQVERVHFRREWLSFHDLGYRATMAAASDLAAMGARPFCALSALTLPEDVDDASFEALVRGQKRAADELDASIVGGNLARGIELSIATTWLGRVERPIGRSAARPGDLLQIAGHLGRAHVGLGALLDGNIADELNAARLAWRAPRALIFEGLRMAATAHAAIDLSDGLALDASRLVAASGVRAVLDAAAMARETELIAPAASALGIEPTEAVLYGGEDYALLVAGPKWIDGFRVIGRVEEGSGLVLDRDGVLTPIATRGFDHFAG